MDELFKIVSNNVGAVIAITVALYYMDRQGSNHIKTVKEFTDTIRKYNEETSRNAILMAEKIQKFTDAINKNTEVTIEQGRIIQELYKRLKDFWLEKKRSIKQVINVEAPKN